MTSEDSEPTHGPKSENRVVRAWKLSVPGDLRLQAWSQSVVAQHLRPHPSLFYLSCMEFAGDWHGTMGMAGKGRVQIMKMKIWWGGKKGHPMFYSTVQSLSLQQLG